MAMATTVVAVSKWLLWVWWFGGMFLAVWWRLKVVKVVGLRTKSRWLLTVSRRKKEVGVEAT